MLPDDILMCQDRLGGASGLPRGATRARGERPSDFGQSRGWASLCFGDDTPRIFRATIAEMGGVQLGFSLLVGSEESET